MMAKEAFEAIKAGLEDAIEFAKSNTRAKVHKIEVPDIDVGELRKRLKLTQQEFAEIFAVPLGTVRNWEQGRRKPEGPAKVLLNIIKKQPDAVLRVLSEI
jgi:putative transcriptional regulator